MSSSAHASVLASASQAFPSGSAAAAAHSATASAKAAAQGGGASTDEAIYRARDKVYPHQLWWLIAAFIGLIAVCQFASWALAKCSRRGWLSSRGQKTAATTAEAGAGGRLSLAGRWFALRNVPTAVINAYRVVAFR